MPADTQPNQPPLTTAGRLAALAAATFVCARTTVDPDLWGHLRFGLDTLAHRRLTAVDPYSFTQDVPWINHEWLSELLLAVFYRSGGTLGLTLLKAGVMALTFWLVWTVARRARESARWWLLAAAIVAMSPASLTNRPQIWTLLGLAALWQTLGQNRRLLWMPVLFAVWANLHGGWIVGAGIAALWLVGRTIDTGSLRTVWPTAVAVAAGVAATVVNPYGWRLWLRLGTTVRMSRNISEWRPLWEQADFSAGILWLIIIALVIATIVRRREAVSWATVLPVAWLGVNSVFVMRLLPLFGEVAVLACSVSWKPDPESSSSTLRRPAMFAVVDAVILACVAAPFLLSESRCLTFSGDWAPDLAATGALTPSTVRGRLIVPFDWGEYAVWHFAPRLRVSMDGRRETIYSQRMLDLQSAVANGRPEGLEYLDRERPEYVWLPTKTGGPTKAWLEANGYRVDVTTADSFVASRADLPAVSIGTPLHRCFP